MKKDVLIIWLIAISVVGFAVFLILNELKILTGGLADWWANFHPFGETPPPGTPPTGTGSGLMAGGKWNPLNWYAYLSGGAS